MAPLPSSRKSLSSSARDAGSTGRPDSCSIVWMVRSSASSACSAESASVVAASTAPRARTGHTVRQLSEIPCGCAPAVGF